MFTGIIKEIGVLKKQETKDGLLEITVHAPLTTAGVQIGDSIAVNGVCLTATYLFKDDFMASVVPETLSRTNLGMLNISSRVNIEPALRVNDRISGHFVAGHIDCLGKFVGYKNIKEGIVLETSFPAEIGKFLARKGSVTLNGVSLTIAELKEETFDVALIPFTREHTNLGSLKVGDLINMEVDLLARYLERILKKG